MPWLVLLLVLVAVPAAAQTPRELRWAADPEGGAPYVEADPADPSRVQGFEVEIAELVARALGRTPRFMFVAYASIDQSVARGDVELGLNGLEDTPARRGTAHRSRAGGAGVRR